LQTWAQMLAQHMCKLMQNQTHLCANSMSHVHFLRCQFELTNLNFFFLKSHPEKLRRNRLSDPKPISSCQSELFFWDEIECSLFFFLFPFSFKKTYWSASLLTKLPIPIFHYVISFWS
jgi:hypothetical protein